MMLSNSSSERSVRRQLIAGHGGLSQVLEGLSRQLDLPGFQHIRQEGVAGGIEEVLLLFRERLPAASGLKVEDLFLGGEAVGSSGIHG